jgi:hypothetical protein
MSTVLKAKQVHHVSGLRSVVALIAFEGRYVILRNDIFQTSDLEEALTGYDVATEPEPEPCCNATWQDVEDPHILLAARGHEPPEWWNDLPSE